VAVRDRLDPELGGPEVAPRFAGRAGL